MASPAPRRKRITTRTTTVWPMLGGMAAVKALKTPHHRTPRVRIRLGPKRSASHPAGVSKSAYPKRDALKTRRRRMLRMAYHPDVFSTAVARLDLARKAHVVSG